MLIIRKSIEMGTIKEKREKSDYLLHKYFFY
jgi:hypothetical protein